MLSLRRTVRVAYARPSPGVENRLPPDTERPHNDVGARHVG